MKSSTTYASDLTTIGDGTQHMIGYAQNAQAGYIEAPTNAQQQDGVVPLDRLPAQWWNWFLNKATRRFTESEDFLENAVAELDNVLDVMGITPDPTSTTQLKTMFSSNYLQQYLPKIAAQASAFSVDGTHENYIPVVDNDGNNGHTLVKIPYAPSLVVNSQLISTAKNITLPANCPYDGQTIKVVFSNGHQAGSASDHMTLNVNNGLSPAPIVSIQNGTLDYLPIHELTAGTYSVLQANTVLEMYYTETGFSGNPAWVIVGNPVVLSSASYTIYADGKKDYLKIQKATENINSLIQCGAQAVSYLTSIFLEPGKYIITACADLEVKEAEVCISISTVANAINNEAKTTLPSIVNYDLNSASLSYIMDIQSSTYLYLTCWTARTVTVRPRSLIALKLE